MFLPSLLQIGCSELCGCISVLSYIPACASTMLPFAAMTLHYSLVTYGNACGITPFAENYFDYTESFVFTWLFSDICCIIFWIFKIVQCWKNYCVAFLFCVFIFLYKILITCSELKPKNYLLNLSLKTTCPRTLKGSCF